jgi:hypothetical protein
MKIIVTLCQKWVVNPGKKSLLTHDDLVFPPKNGMGYGAIGTYGSRLIFPTHQIGGLDFSMG